MNEPKRTGVRIIGSTASGNKAGGIYIGRGAEAEIIDTHVSDNGGKGIEVEGSEQAEPMADPVRNDDRWYKKPLGVLALAVSGTLLAAAAKWAIEHYFP